MRIFWTALALGAAGAVANCVGDTGTSSKGPGDEGEPCFANGTCNPNLTCVSKVCVNLASEAGGPDGGTDTGSPTDGGQDAGQDAGNDTGSSDAGGGMITCLDPTACSKVGDTCCGTITLGAGTPPNCAINATSTKCQGAATCPTALSSNCSSMHIVRPCSVSAQCIEASYNKCCAFKYSDGGSINFCMSASLAAILGTTCN